MPSFEKFSYALRPAKNIERKMLCESFARLARLAPLPTYRYVGFGAIGFHDFSLFHQRLGIHDMLSIEEFIDGQDRIDFNRPYSCIKMGWGSSHAILPTLSWKKRCIVWLDYETNFDRKKLDDIGLVASACKSGSILVVTLPADSGPVEQNVDMATKRINDLKARLGPINVPDAITGASLARWGMAKAYRQIIDNTIARTLGNRNAPLEKKDRFHYEQLFNFNYADGVKMVTVGGMIVNTKERGLLSRRHFKDLPFIRNADEPCLIEAPLLTRREVRYLDERLPKSAPKVLSPKWIPEEERKRYAQVYRYFPSFSEVEL